ncbi:DUF6712 family protein [Spirosoma endbachense]|uniref:Uncharacterized protein n=1 Tax=Spirosoma endbachense TaxID=2666025 RepID=A0A6P1W1T8_9BACT|nr:DUF6712 family protein [Spirosoma endbachense]QHV97950.1 hypothetical protein GJR95_24370 [Spirosoma endbachense]
MTKMLINSMEELKAILGGIQKAMYWATWESYVRQAEMKYIIPAIGQELYDELTAVTEPTNAQKPLLTRLKNAVAYFAYMEALPFLVTQTGDAGIVMSTPPNTANISKWMYVVINKEVSAKSDFWLEDSLQWLENHAALFVTWTASEAYTINQGRFISSATQLTTAFPAAKNSRRLFLEFRQYLFNEEDFLQTVLGSDFFESLQTRLTNPANVFTPKESTVLRLGRKALAHHAFMKALPYLNLNVDYRIVSETDGIVNEDELPDSRLNMILADCRKVSGDAVAELTKYLNANASSLIFPEWFNSERYRPPVALPMERFPNTSTNPFFVL